jgi:hypothetical protein
MSLLNPTPGEILDRLSILELKIPAFEKYGWASEDLEAEKAGLEERMKDWDQGLREDMVGEVIYNQIAEGRNALAAVNALLWDAEDDVRRSHPDELTKLARLCQYIAKMNDSRNKHINKLNGLYGLHIRQEKIYSTKTVVSDLDLCT